MQQMIPRTEVPRRGPLYRTKIGWIRQIGVLECARRSGIRHFGAIGPLSSQVVMRTMILTYL